MDAGAYAGGVAAEHSAEEAVLQLLHRVAESNVNLPEAKLELSTLPTLT